MRDANLEEELVERGHGEALNHLLLGKRQWRVEANVARLENTKRNGEKNLVAEEDTAIRLHSADWLRVGNRFNRRFELDLNSGLFRQPMRDLRRR